MSFESMAGQPEEISLADILAREAEEVFEFLKVKGPPLEGFKREYIELQTSLDTLLDSIATKEREVEIQNAELAQVKDQLMLSRRAIDDAQVQKENLQANIDHIQATQRNLIDREVANRSEIGIYSGEFEELKIALAQGSGWTHEQEEEKHNLEKSRDFLIKKLENKTNLVNGVRSDVDKLYELIQHIESQVAEIDSKIESMNNEIKHNNKRASDQKQLAESLETKIRELQQSLTSAERELEERSKLQQGIEICSTPYQSYALMKCIVLYSSPYIKRCTLVFYTCSMIALRMLRSGEDKTLNDLEASLNASKARMEEYLREYGGLVRTTIELTGIGG